MTWARYCNRTDYLHHNTTLPTNPFYFFKGVNLRKFVTDLAAATESKYSTSAPLHYFLWKSQEYVFVFPLHSFPVVLHQFNIGSKYPKRTAVYHLRSHFGCGGRKPKLGPKVNLLFFLAVKKNWPIRFLKFSIPVIFFTLSDKKPAGSRSTRRRFPLCPLALALSWMLSCSCSLLLAISNVFSALLLSVSPSLLLFSSLIRDEATCLPVSAWGSSVCVLGHRNLRCRRRCRRRASLSI